MKDNKKDTLIRKQVDVLGRPGVEMLDREIARLERRESYIRLARGIIISLVAAAAVIILITNLWVGVLRIDGTSMSPLLEMNEIVLTKKSDITIKKDIIAFYHNNKLHIKRVIATAGDTVNIDAYGVVSVNGHVLNEPYVEEHSLGNCDIELPFHVASGTVFVMGDNRSVSVDSRDSHFGPVPREQVIGKVRFIVWPLSRAGKIS
ncbi:MAG: signal peptidase I [Oscillospiraceae bacterium]|nr:signal peptidase I [Oscillospiraceae bacterium]